MNSVLEWGVCTVGRRGGRVRLAGAHAGVDEASAGRGREMESPGRHGARVTRQWPGAAVLPGRIPGTHKSWHFDSELAAHMPREREKTSKCEAAKEWTARGWKRRKSEAGVQYSNTVQCRGGAVWT